jgi:hypothetical protein
VNGSGRVNEAPGVIWKLGRVWTGFNPNDIDKTGGQSQPAKDTVYTREANWPAGIWIWRALFPNDWGPGYTPFFDACQGYAAPSCSPDSACDSQGFDRNSSDCWDTAEVTSGNSYGHLRRLFNANSAINSDGTWTSTQDWHHIEMRMKNRTNSGTADGAFQMWIDGNEVTDWSVSPAISASMVAGDYGLNFVRFNDNFNRLTTNIADGATQEYYIDDVVISTTYTGPSYTIGGGSPATPRRAIGGPSFRGRIQ